MNYIKVTTTYPTGGTLLPNAFVDNYMIRANGEYIKVYIYLLRMVSDGANFSIPCLAVGKVIEEAAGEQKEI